MKHSYINLLLRAAERTDKHKDKLPEMFDKLPSWFYASYPVEYYSVGAVCKRDGKGHANSLEQQTDIVAEFISRLPNDNKWVSFDTLLYEAFICRMNGIWYPYYEEAKQRYPKEVQDKAKEIILIQSN